MKLIFDELSFSNFMLFGKIKTTIKFDNNVTTSILGSNGVGKSTIINAFVYSIFGKALSDIEKTNLINNINEKDMETSISFHIGSDHYFIKRTRKNKIKVDIEVLKNGSPDIAPDKITDIDKFIEEHIIGISFELFCRIVVFSALHTPFLSLPLRSKQYANQVDIIEEIFNMKILSEKAEALKKIMDETQKAFELKTKKVEQLKKEKERHNEQIRNAKERIERWNVEKDKSINTIDKKIKMVEGIDIEQQKTLYEKKNVLSAKAKDVVALKKRLADKCKQFSNKMDQIEKEVSHLKDDKCPYCLQKFPNSLEKISELERDFNDLESQMNKCNDDVSILDDERERINTEIVLLEKDIVVRNLDELIEIKTNMENLLFQKTALEGTPNPHISHYEELKRVKLESVDTKELDTIASTMEHQKFLYKLLTKRDSFVRKKLLDRNLPYLNSRISEYLQEIGLPHVVRFTEEMTVDITRFGRKLSFGMLSTGQKGRVNLALSFAFRDVLQRLYMPINICLLDEIFDSGMDELGIASVVSLIRHKTREEKSAMYIISHKEETRGAFDRTISVVIEDGFSVLKQ